MKYKNIAISGEIGTGKSTMSHILVQKLGWKYENAGDFFRSWMKEHNIPLEKTTEIPPELDKKIDFGFRDQMSQNSDTIFESRLAGWLAKDIPTVLKVLVVCEFNTAMKRSSGRDDMPLEFTIKSNETRSIGIREKFKRLYGVDDYLDTQYFDLVVDTTNISPEEAAAKVLEQLNS